jgi:outer membrane protein, multidrug efflux system
MRNPMLMVSILVMACASAPSYQAPSVVVPTAFREKAGEAVQAEEAGQADSAGPDENPWQALGDSTLDRLEAEVVHANLDVMTAEARVRGARASRTGATLDFAPTVVFGGSYTRERLSTASFPINVGSFPDQNVWDAGFDAAWEIDLFGRVRHNVQAQGALVQASQEDLRNVRVTLAAELARTYFELRGAQQRLAVAQLNAANQRNTLKVTQERLDAGQGTAFDTERAQAQVSSTLATIPTLESQVAAAQYRIGVLVGRPPAAVAMELVAVAELPPLPDSIPLTSPDSLVRGRPDVAAAERQLAAGRAFVSAAKSAYLPRLAVGGSAGFTARTFGSLGNDGTFRYAVGPVISWPFLNLGRVKANVDVSRAQESEAEAQYTQTVLGALAEVETALARYRTSRARLDRLEEAAAASERAADLARLRFSEGVTDFLQVLDAERTQLDAQDQSAQGRTDAATAYAGLVKAVGGGW